MEFRLNDITLSDKEADIVRHMVSAIEAKAILSSWDYFSDFISEESSNYLRSLCNHDFTTLPDNSVDERWFLDMEILTSLNKNIFEVHRHIKAVDYSMPYPEDYSMTDRIMRWSKIRGAKPIKDAAFINDMIMRKMGLNSNKKYDKRTDMTPEERNDDDIDTIIIPAVIIGLFILGVLSLFVEPQLVVLIGIGMFVIITIIYIFP